MIKDVLQSIGGVEIYPIVSLILFFVSFLAVTFLALMKDKTELVKISRLPLDESDYLEETKNKSGGE